MKKTTLLKNLLKSPPNSIKALKSTQKYQFTANDVHQTYTIHETLKMKIEKMNDSLNQEIRQRQFEFKQLYKIVTDLKKSKKSKCKHSVVVMQRNQSPQQITHIPFTVLQNNFKDKISDDVSELNLSQKYPYSINDFSQLSILKKQNTQINLIKKQKRQSKCGIIKSHKYLPTIYSSSHSIQIQNEEENQDNHKSNLQTTTSQFFSNSHSNFNFDNKEIVSPTKSIISNSKVLKQKNTQENDMKISYFENKLKSLQASHTFLKEKVDTSLLKQADITQQLKNINSKIQTQLNSQHPIKRVVEEIQKKIKQVESDLNQKYQEVSEQTSNNFKNIQSLIYECEKQKNQHQQEITDLSSQIEHLSCVHNELTLFKTQKHQMECKYQQIHQGNQKQQSQTIARIEALESAQGDLFKEFGDLVSLKDQKLESSKIKQCTSQNQSFADPSFYSDKMSEVESRLESTEEIVSELVKVSLTLTQKMNKLTNCEYEGSKRMKQNKQESGKMHQNKSGLSEGYWSLKEELNKIDEEPIESSRQVIDESFVYNEENEEEFQVIGKCEGQRIQGVQE